MLQEKWFGLSVCKSPFNQNEVTTTYGKKVGRASYINYYIANNRVLVPNYNDPNDAVANNIIQQLYPDKRLSESIVEISLPMVVWYTVLRSSNPDKIML